MAEYQLLNDTTSVLRRADNSYIPDDPANRDRQIYSDWLADGNTPDPAPIPPEPPPPEPVELPAQPEAPMDAATKSYVDVEIAKMGVRINALENWARGTPA
jgi:hypothetical protein